MMMHRKKLIMNNSKNMETLIKAKIII
jgi:hypothetical protein